MIDWKRHGWLPPRFVQPHYNEATDGAPPAMRLAMISGIQPFFRLLAPLAPDPHTSDWNTSRQGEQL